jgi:hypothetical protein
MSRLVKWLAPLTIFVVGMITILILTIFFPAIGSTQDSAISTIGPSQMSAFTGLSWAMTSIRLLLFIGLIFVVLITLAIVWLRRK